MKFTGSALVQGYWDASVEGVSRDENPYPDGSKERLEWFDGYSRWEDEELKKDYDIAEMGGEPC